MTQPARLKSSVSSPAWRDDLWAEIRVAGRFTLIDLVAKTGVAARAARDYVTGLTRAGFIEVHDSSSANWVYRLVRNVGPEAPMLNHNGREMAGYCIREALWRTMKILNEFTVRDLAVHANTERCRVTEREARTYLRALVAAGYIIARKRDAEGRAPAGRLISYRFLSSRNTGPKPPVLQQVLQVYDGNEGKVVWRAGGGGA